MTGTCLHARKGRAEHVAPLITAVISALYGTNWCCRSAAECRSSPAHCEQRRQRQVSRCAGARGRPAWQPFGPAGRPGAPLRSPPLRPPAVLHVASFALPPSTLQHFNWFAHVVGCTALPKPSKRMRNRREVAGKLVSACMKDCSRWVCIVQQLADRTRTMACAAAVCRWLSSCTLAANAASSACLALADCTLAACCASRAAMRSLHSTWRCHAMWV